MAKKASLSFLRSLPSSFQLDVKVNPSTGCWVWIGHFLYGYPDFRVRKSHNSPLRFAWRHSRGSLASHEKLYLGCVSKYCVNPFHANKYNSVSLMEYVLSRSRWTENGCLEWTGAAAKGHPLALFRGKTIVVRPTLWRELKGAIPPKKYIRMRCKNNLCLNPAHMLASTVRGNSWSYGPYLYDKEKYLAILFLKGRVSLRNTIACFGSNRRTVQFIWEGKSVVGNRISKDYSLPPTYIELVDAYMLKLNLRRRWIPFQLRPLILEQVQAAVLPKRDRAILISYFALDLGPTLNLAEAAESHGLSGEGARLIIQSTVSKLKMQYPESHWIRYLQPNLES